MPLELSGCRRSYHVGSQTELATMAPRTARGLLLALHYGLLEDQGKLRHVQVSLRNRRNGEAAPDTGRAARAMLGGAGTSEAYPVIRHMMNLEEVATTERTREVHTSNIGRALTRIAAFS